jgi:hypothetical protein
MIYELGCGGSGRVLVPNELAVNISKQKPKKPCWFSELFGSPFLQVGDSVPQRGAWPVLWEDELRWVT